MRKMLYTALMAGLLMALMAVPALANNGKSSAAGGRAATELTVMVDSTGLTYDSIVTTQLPPHGPFQKLVPVDGQLTTA
jgi:hypothetical protein